MSKITEAAEWYVENYGHMTPEELAECCGNCRHWTDIEATPIISIGLCGNIRSDFCMELTHNKFHCDLHERREDEDPHGLCRHEIESLQDEIAREGETYRYISSLKAELEAQSELLEVYKQWKRSIEDSGDNAGWAKAHEWMLQHRDDAKTIDSLKAELATAIGERDRQYDENVARIAAEGAAILRAEKAEAELAVVRESSIEACNPVRYSASKDDPWWVPQLVDHEFCERLRKDYPEDAHLGDEEIAEVYKYTLGKYATTWDNLDDAYNQFQRLADAYFNLKQQLTPSPHADPLEEYYRNPGPVDGMVESSGNPFESHAETIGKDYMDSWENEEL